MDKYMLTLVRDGEVVFSWRIAGQDGDIEDADLYVPFAVDDIEELSERLQKLVV